MSIDLRLKYDRRVCEFVVSRLMVPAVPGGRPAAIISMSKMGGSVHLAARPFFMTPSCRLPSLGTFSQIVLHLVQKPSHNAHATCSKQFPSHRVTGFP